MKKIIIIGSGFAGLACAFRLSSSIKKLDLEISVISDKDVFSFLPMLPDCLGRGVAPDSLTYSIKKLSKKFRFNFIKDKVIRLDLDKKQVVAQNATFSYDFLVIASGSETNFYGNEQIKQAAFKLDDAQDAALMRKALEKESYSAYLVVGGGYTGVEVATNLSIYLKKKKFDKRVVIIERASEILGPLPGWMKDYVLANFKELKIEVLIGSSVKSAKDGRIELSDGKIFENSMFIWAAGVKTGEFIQNLSAEKNPQGRIKVDKFLKFHENCFAAGDTSLFDFKGSTLRMAVQFAIMQGDCIGKNIVRSVQAKELLEYKPIDLGYVIPMANNKSCGKVLGVNLKGFLPTLMHYFMCIFRTYGFKSRLRIVKELIMKGA